MTDLLQNGKLMITCILLVWGATACKTAKKATEAAPAPAVSHKAPDAANYAGQRLSYTSFSGKADIEIKTETQNQNLVLNLRMQKDKDIWASVLAMGLFEAARAYMTPDSLLGLDRLSKTAYMLSYEEGMQLIRADIPFPMLQNLIIGNPFIQDVPIAGAEVKDSMILITQDQGEFEQVLTYHLQSHALQHLSLKSSRRDFRCEINYGGYRPVALKQPFAFSRNIQIEQDGKKIVLDLNFNRAQIDVPVDMSFSIPVSYRQGIIKK